MVSRKLQFLALSLIVALSVTAGMFIASGLNLTPSTAASPATPSPSTSQTPAISLPNFAEIAESANPAVVGITSTSLIRGDDPHRRLFRDPFEFFFGHFILRETWTRLFADYNILRGRFWLLVLGSQALAPVVVGRVMGYWS